MRIYILEWFVVLLFCYCTLCHLLLGHCTMGKEQWKPQQGYYRAFTKSGVLVIVHMETIQCAYIDMQWCFVIMNS